MDTAEEAPLKCVKIPSIHVLYRAFILADPCRKYSLPAYWSMATLGHTMEQHTEPLTLREAIEHVRAFHDAFGIPNAEAPTAALADRDALLRYKLIREENEEYLDAALRGDLVEVADALGDILYILCGTLLKHGLEHKIDEVFREIQRSNMSKLDANGKAIYRDDGKVMKSELYFRPDIARILE
jgi:predicted HAD superfamily Cof-like phosphohydrolase